MGCEGSTCKIESQNSDGGCCEGNSCQCGCGTSYEEKMMILVKEAKMELIKEKMKKKLEAVEGKKLDRIADLFVEAMLEKKQLKKAMEHKMDELSNKFEAIMKE